MRIAYLFLLLLSLPFYGYGQDFNYIQYTTADGLPTNYVYGVIEDDDGFIWAYTENGIAKFDGYTFKNFGIKEGLSNSDVPVMVKDKYGTLWASPFQGNSAYIIDDSIHTLRDANANKVRIFNGIPYIYTDADSANQVGQIDISKTTNQDTFFIQYTGMTKERVYKEMSDPSFPFDSSENINIIHSGIILNEAKTTIATFVDDKWKTCSIPPYAHPNHSIWVYHLSDSKYFILSLFGKSYIVDFASEPVSKFAIPNSDTKNYIYTFVDSLLLVQDNEPNEAILHYDFNGKLTREYHCTSLSKQNYIHRPYIDSKNNLWITTRENGIFLVPSTHLKTQILHQEHEHDIVFERIVRDPSTGKLICITDNSSIYEIKNDDLITIKRYKKTTRHRATIATDRNLIISLSDGIYELENGKTKKTPIGFQNFRNLTYNRQNNSVYGVLAGPTFKWPANDPKPSPQLIASLPIAGYYHDSVGMLYLYQNKVTTDIELTKNLKNLEGIKHISTLYGTKSHLWIGSQAAGAFHYDLQSGTLSNVVDDCLVRNIRQDSDSTILLATNKGVIIRHKNPSNSYFKAFTTLDGLSTNDVLDVYAFNDSIIYAATANGMNKINRTAKSNTTIQPRELIINKIISDDHEYTIDNIISLHHEQNDINIHYLLRSYESAGKIVYKTKLKPIEDDWTVTTARNQKYIDLSPGTYTFHLQAQNAYGDEIEHEPIEFTIVPALWQRTWFRGLSLLLFSGLLFYLIRRRDQARKNKLAIEKRLHSKIADLKLSALRAQMNPHFIFNALGAIQYYIQTNDEDKADDYLTKFAKLMRLYLDGSKEKFIFIQKEMDLLELYLSLEKIRFEDKFDYHIDVDQNLIADDMQIPTMMIQPFVENAINHGLALRTEKGGLLQINAIDADDHISITISDNGIGRKRAGEFKRVGHTSKGLRIIQEKINHLRESNLADIQLTITDLQPTAPTYPGTKVTLQFKKFSS